MKHNRGRNEGSLSQRASGAWRAQVSQKGARISRDFRSKADAVAWLRMMMSNIDRGFQIRGSTITVSEYLEGWLETHRQSIKTRTAYQYEGLIKNHVTPHIGELRLRDLNLSVIEGFYSNLLNSGVGPRTIKITSNVLHKAFEKAVRYGLLFNNPVHGATLPSYHCKEMKILDRAQVGIFLKAAKESPHYALYYLAISTGMRLGELLGLKWADIDLETGILHVLRQKQYSPGDGFVLVEPKTNAGRRTIRIGDGSVQVLRQHFENQKGLREQMKKRWVEMDLVFSNSFGRPGDASNIRLDFNKVLISAGLPKIRFHDLRHTAASLLLNNRIPVIVVSNMLGHSKPSVTLDIYAHVLSEMQGEAARVMDKLITPIVFTKSNKLQKLNYLHNFPIT